MAQGKADRPVSDRTTDNQPHTTNRPESTGGEALRSDLTPDSDGSGKGRTRWPGPP